MADELATLEPESAAELARVQLSQARARLQYAVRALKADAASINLPRRLKSSIAERPLLWVGGAFAVGALLGVLTRRFEHGDE